MYFCKRFLKLFIYLLFFKYSYLHFPPTTLPCPTDLYLLPLILPLCFVHMSFTHVPWWPFPFFSPLSPSPLPAVYSQFVFYFNVFGSILLAYFVDQVPLLGEIIWYLSFIAWLISLSIMFYSSIHPVPKGRSSSPSFFLLCSIPLYKRAIDFWSIHLLMGT